MNYHFLGYIGTFIIVVGYLPQIIHLIKEKCAWGISQRSWILWLIGGIFLLAYSMSKQDMVFSLVQTVQIVAISLTIFYARRSTQTCPYHYEQTQSKT